MLKRPLSFGWYPHHFVYGGVGCGFPVKGNGANGEVVGAIGVGWATPTVQNGVDCAREALVLVSGAVPVG